MKIIEKDILTVEKGIICHQVNCQRVMGSGIAKSIKAKWPIVYKKYKSFHQDKPDFYRLGRFQFVQVEGGDFPILEVCNVYGQLNYGGEERQTDYGALNMAFLKMKDMVHSSQQFYFPFLFGCGLANGDWSIVSKMIDFYFPNAIICKLPK